MGFFSCRACTKTINIFDDFKMQPNSGVSTTAYTPVNGYRYVNVFVKFEQLAAGEAPVSLGVIFAFSSNGEMGSRRYFNFEQNFGTRPDPQFIDLSGANSWSGAPHNRSSYNARLPVMGPYMQVFPFNHHNQARKVSVRLYLTS